MDCIRERRTSNACHSAGRHASKHDDRAVRLTTTTTVRHAISLRVVVSTALAWAMTSHAVAQQQTLDSPTYVAPFWREVQSPGSIRAEQLVANARAIVQGEGSIGGEWTNACRAMRSEDGFSTYLREWALRSAALENAEARLRRAQELSPRDPRIAFLLAWVVEAWQRPLRNCSARRRDEEAVTLFRAVRDLDPNYRAEEVAFELGILHSRLNQSALAIAEYERRLQVSLNDDDTSSVHGNLAEVLMQSGDLTNAVAHYEEAVRIAERRGNATAELSLARWGLAVALDRLGEVSAALAAARRAMEANSNSMSVLRDRGVFFVPAYELHYIEALGQLSLRDTPLNALPSAPAESAGSEAVLQQLEIVASRPMSDTSLARIRDAAADYYVAESESSRAEAAATLLRAIHSNERTGLDARTMSNSQRRVTCLFASARSFLRYLNDGGASGRWAQNARNHLRDIARALTAEQSR